jgi:hypothetical protein
MSINSN